ncbi:protein MraZ [Firmicutes bacterium CAG:882]|jgi:MraZ protein|nr:protein MraZ [Firmicutes bacterium CAG:882]
MTMFMGEYSHSIDAKGRLIMPAKFREQLGDEFVVTKSPDKCLYVYTNEEWKNFEEKLATLPITNKGTRQFVRFFLAGAASCEVDKQGRILLPAVLREYAELDKEVVLAGTSKRIEIWNKDRYLADQKEYEDNIDEIASNMESFGFSI